MRMLTHIYIRDLATIEELDLHFLPGSTTITGETGAGKSVFIEAIELALGGRASPNLIRAGKEKAEITTTFNIARFPHVISMLKELDLYLDTPECIVRRILTADGRSRCYVNGSPVTVHLIKELGELLFHLHGQHEQQVLLKSETQREMLDRYADHLELVAEIKQLAETYKQLDAQLVSLKTKSLERTERTQYLKFQLDELAAVNLKEGEWEILEADHKRLSHSEELTRQIQAAMNLMTDDRQSALAVANEMRKLFENLINVEPKARDWSNVINSVIIQLNDLESDLQNYLETAELDPEKLQLLETRVSQVFHLSRKYKISPQELVAYHERIATDLKALDDSDEAIKQLEQQLAEIKDKYRGAADCLSRQRQAAAKKIQHEMTATIRSLSLPHGDFRIEFEKETTPFSPHGNERIVFMIKTNPDQSLQPLGKVISGGELSRLSLAAHLALAHKTSIPTLVFDEVDTGLSGATAVKIGKLLRKLGQSYQVFCITHQAQVAAYGHQHLLVEKYIDNNATYTRLKFLDVKTKTKEIARMLGGEKITAKTLEHAQEILQSV